MQITLDVTVVTDGFREPTYSITEDIAAPPVKFAGEHAQLSQWLLDHVGGTLQGGNAHVTIDNIRCPEFPSIEPMTFLWVFDDDADADA